MASVEYQRTMTALIGSFWYPHRYAPLSSTHIQSDTVSLIIVCRQCVLQIFYHNNSAALAHLTRLLRYVNIAMRSEILNRLYIGWQWPHLLLLFGQCCSHHLACQRVVGHISAVRSCWSICSVCSESKNANLLLHRNVYFASHTKRNLTYDMSACSWWP